MTLGGERFGIVRHRRWLAWGYRGGVMVRPAWLARAIVTTWNWLSCHTLGHEWCPEIDCENGQPVFSETEEFCPNCPAVRRVG